jgi:FMN phosphatase YigB (HAD superfamily)
MIRAVISDLGNVLLHFDHRIIAARLAHDFPDAAWTDAATERFWDIVKGFENGAMDTEVFLHEIAVVLGMERPLDPESFRRLWGDIFWLNEEYLDLMRELKDTVTLVMLSNTNPLHIDFARERFPEVFEVFSHTVFSYEIGLGKPEPAIFEEALRVSGTASALGIHGYQYVSLQGTHDVLAMHDMRTERIH